MTSVRRPVPTGSTDSLGRQIRVSDRAATNQVTAPPPPTGEPVERFEDRVVARGADDDTWVFPEGKSVSTGTPWGRAQVGYRYGPGVNSYSCSGHGGFKVAATKNGLVHAAIRKDDGWYEEDCDWAAVAVTFPEMFPRKHVAAAVSSLKNDNPDGWETFSGQRLDVSESSKLRERAFKTAHAGDPVALSAAGAFGPAPMGMGDKEGNRIVGEHLDRFVTNHEGDTVNVESAAAEIVDAALGDGAIRSAGAAPGTAERLVGDWVRKYGEPVGDGEVAILRSHARLGVYHETPQGMVRVSTTLGGERTRDAHAASQDFLVPADEYQTRGPYGFVVDPSRHEQIVR